MKKETKSKQIIERANAYDNGYAKGLRDGKAKSEYFAVLETCKEDMKEEFEASEKIQLEIEQFTDEQMEDIAQKISDLLMEGYEAALHIAVEEELNAR
jgi:hypothetical protein